MPYVYSTATCDSIFAVYQKTEAGQAGVIKKQVLIKGGANVAKGRGLITKYGHRTEISEEDLQILEASPNFQQAVKNSFYKVSRHKVNAEGMAAEMEARDESAPLVPEDYADDDLAKPKDVVKAETEGDDVEEEEEAEEE